MKNYFSRGCTLVILCLAFTLGACTSGSYYSSGAANYSRPYTYPSSGTPYYGESGDRHSRTYSYPGGTTTLPYASYYYRNPGYPSGTYYSRSDYYRTYDYYRPYQFYYPYQYYRHRPYKYYRHPPHKKKDHDYRSGKRYRSNSNYRRHRVDSDLGLRGTYRIKQRGSIRRGYRGKVTVRSHQGLRIRAGSHRQQHYRSHRGPRAGYDRRVGGMDRATGRSRHRATTRAHRPAGGGLRR